MIQLLFQWFPGRFNVRKINHPAAVGLNGALYRFYHSTSKEGRPDLAGTGLVFSGLLSVPATILLYMSFPAYGELLFQFPGQNALFLLVLPRIPFTLMGNYLSGFMILVGKSRLFVMLSLGNTLFALLLNIILIAGFHLGIKGLLLATMISSIPRLFVFYWGLRGYLRLRFRREDANRMIRFGAPLILAGISGWIMSSANRFFLQRYSTFDEVGLYSLAQRFAVALQFIVITPVVQAWSRTAFENQNSEKLPQLSRTMMRYYISVILLLAVSASLLLPSILHIIATPQYKDAALAFPFLAGAYFSFGLNRMFEIPLHLKNRSGISSSLGTVAMLSSLVFNFLLVPSYGMVGAAMATWLAYLLNNFNFYLIARRINPMPYPIGSAAALSGLALTVCVLGLGFVHGGMALPVRMLLVLLFAAATLYWNRHDLPRLFARIKTMQSRLIG